MSGRFLFAAGLVGLFGVGSPRAEAAQAPFLEATQSASQSTTALRGAVGARPAAAEFGVEEVVVTAQKRRETVQTTAAAVTAVVGASLIQAGVTDIRGVQDLVPGARFQQEGNSTQVFLRGVGSNLDYGNIEQSVSFSFDGVYIPREGTSVPLFDIQRVEVLPGPQGTLYGRSAIGGTVNVAFRRPSRQAAASGLIEVGDYGLVHVSLATTMPVRSDLAMRAAVDYTRRDGYMESGAHSANDVAGRLSLLYEPTPGTQLYVWGMAVNKSGSPPNLVNKGYDLATGAYDQSAFLRRSAWEDLRPGALAAFAPFGQPKAPTQVYDNFAVGAQLDLELGDAVVMTYIPSLYYLNASTKDYWLGGIPANESAHYHQITQEFRLSKSNGRLNWLSGLYGYQTLNGGLAQVLVGTPLVFDASHVIRNELEGAAAFGQASLGLTPRLRLTLGGRYGVDHRTGRGVSPLNGEPYRFDKAFYHGDYKLGAEYDVAPAVMAYATYQTGYQPGTYNEAPSTSTFSNLVKDATLASISAGLKSRFLRNRLQIDDELFYYDYHNLFIQAYDASKAYNPIFNADKVTIPGDQLDIVFEPTAADKLASSLSYTHARNQSFVTPSGGNYDGLLPPYAADWTASLSYSHDFPLTRGYVRAQADARYESEFYADFIHNLGVRQSPAVKQNAEVAYHAQDGRWSLGLWVKNISNVAVIAATAAAGIPGPATSYLEPPRTFGARASLQY